MVPLLVILTIVVFILIDLLLRYIIFKYQEAKRLKARKEALEEALRLDFSDEAPTLKRVEVENPKARILAVDDEEVVLASFRKILAMDGFSIDTVQSGKEALGLIQKHDYDFLFVDLKMPEMDGVEVTKAAKHFRPDIDVIIITGYATVEAAVETMKHGAMDFVQKPFTEEELVDFVNKCLIRRRERIERETKPQVHLITPSSGPSRSKHEINVPAGVFVSKAHTWVSLELNGLVKVGLDDFTIKLLGAPDSIEFPETGAKVKKGAPLFTIVKDGQRLSFPSPVNGRVVDSNKSLGDHIDYLRFRPYDLGWICALEPESLPGDLQGLFVGAEAYPRFKEDIDRYWREYKKRAEGESTTGKPEEDTRKRWEAFRTCFLEEGTGIEAREG